MRMSRKFASTLFNFRIFYFDAEKDDEAKL